jgi:hypothetical protein
MTSVPSRNEWTTKVQAGTSEISIEHHTVFGWKVQKHSMPSGAVMITNSVAEVPRSRAPNRAMYVTGRCTVTNNDEVMDDRVPGLFTGERPSHPAGLSKVTAVEDTEFWCFNYFMNRKALPVLTPVRVPAGQMLQLTTGQLLFVMKGVAGSITGPMTLTPDTDQELTVTQDLYAFLIANERT